LWRAGFASQPVSTARDDGLALADMWITAAVRCAPPANRPTPIERDRCLTFAERELQLLTNVRVVLCLGAFAWDAALRLIATLAGERAPAPSPRPRFGHGAELSGEPYSLLGCYHPSQQNTFTGRLTEPMIDAVLRRARELAERPLSV
jgi:uracil-DNA glycosylase family 4